MAKAHKNKKGLWQIRIYNKSLGTQKHFTADSRMEVERMALEWAAIKKEDTDACITLQKAAESFLESRTRVLSPNTLRGYTGILRVLGPIKETPINELTSERLQAWVNDQAGHLSPKTISNQYGFITAVIRSVMPQKTFSVRLPENPRPKLEMPSESEIKALIKAAENTPLEIPVLLALFGPMRRAEISALTADDINGNIIHVRAAIAKGPSGDLSQKAPKTRAGDRYIAFPAWVIAKLPPEGKITPLTPDAITRRFERLSKQIKFPYTFHQLRHWSVSYLHRAGLSEQEILDRAGWTSSGIFREVYRHGTKDSDRALEAFSRFQNTPTG